jgi:hypothetical protein
MNRKKHNSRLGLFAVAAAIALPGAAGADQTFPPRKPGFWVTTMVMHMSMPGMVADKDSTPIISAMCTDPATDALSMKRMAGDNGKCSQFDITHAGNVYAISGTCADPMGGGVMTTAGTITFVSDTEIHSESKTSSAHFSGDETGDSKWSGACPAGVVPGDIGHMINGQFVKLTNINNLPKTPGD